MQPVPFQRVLEQAPPPLKERDAAQQQCTRLALKIVQKKIPFWHLNFKTKLACLLIEKGASLKKLKAGFQDSNKHLMIWKTNLPPVFSPEG